MGERNCLGFLPYGFIVRVGMLIYGDLDTLSGGYLYDRKLVQYLRSQGDEVEVIS